MTNRKNAKFFVILCAFNENLNCLNLSLSFEEILNYEE